MHIAFYQEPFEENDEINYIFKVNDKDLDRDILDELFIDYIENYNIEVKFEEYKKLMMKEREILLLRKKLLADIKNHFNEEFKPFIEDKRPDLFI